MLLALEPENWAHLVTTGPSPSSAAPLESIRQACLELLSPPGGSVSPENGDGDRSSTKPQGDNAIVVAGGAKETPDDHTMVAALEGA